MADTLTKTRNPDWWTNEHTSAWDRVKEAFRRDWEQTKHDVGAGGKDLDQDVPETLGQAAGTQPIPPRDQPNYEADEAAARFGYGARRQYGSQYSQWNNDLEERLRRDWEATGQPWDRSHRAIRRGWDYTR